MQWWWDGNPRMTGDLVSDMAEVLLILLVAAILLIAMAAVSALGGDFLG